MADIVGAVAGFLSCLCTPDYKNTPVIERYKYVMNSKRYIEKLGKMKKDIIARQKDIISKLQIAEVVPEVKRSNVVVNWLTNVDQFLAETNEIEKEASKTRSKVRMGSSIARLLRDATELLEKVGGLSEGELTITTKRRGNEIQIGRIIGETTAHKTMERVWGCLINDEVGIVGVCGMGGIGKTTIVKKINNRLLEEKYPFDLVIWVTVSQSTSISQIQTRIARSLNHSLPQTEDETEASTSLFGALKQKKKFVLILDDMWEDVSLEKIGIPEPTQENGCKILLTTRNLDVCRKMGCRENTIRVELLSESEAWELFMDKVDVDLSEEVKNVAKSVVRECACLPLALITVGGAMRRKKEISEWRNALNDLKYSRKQVVDMEKKVFNYLKFSYDRLPDENVQKCFLYCALFPEDWEIKTVELIDYWIMGGLIEGKDSQDEIDQGRSILNKLRNHCLLESMTMYNYRSKAKETIVKMHDLVRDMALKFTSLLPSIVRAGVMLKEVPKESEWGEDLQSASFMYNEISEISISPRCPKLFFLLLNANWILRTIQKDFFVHLQGLKVLDLSQNLNIKFLPDSISDLVNLRGLLLEGCYQLTSLPSLHKLQLLRTLDLRENRRLQSLPDSISELTNLLVLRLSHCGELKSIPSVAKLRTLRNLELDRSGIMELPQGMEMLVNLTFLDLDKTNFKFRETTPSGLLSALSSLKSLHLEGLPLETVYALGRSNRGIWEDLLSLKHLESLFMSFSSLSECANYVGSPNYKGLKTFRIRIGSSYTAIKTPSSGDSYRSFTARYPDDVPYDENFLPQNTQHFHIGGFKDMKSLNELRCLKDARQLRECIVEECEELEYIIKHEEEEDECTLLQGLEVLRIKYCHKLDSVYKGSLSSFYCLTKLEIKGCQNLKNVFSSPRLLLQLPSLEFIIIISCKQMEDLIKAETAEEEEGEATNIVITLPKLKQLFIWQLPNLKNIWNGEMICDSLEILRVRECPEMKRIPTHRGEKQSPPPLLRSIKGSNEWWDTLEWDHPSAKMLFKPFFEDEDLYSLS